MPRPERDSQASAAASAGLGEVFALLTRLCLEPALGVEVFCRKPGTGEATESLPAACGSLLMPLPPKLTEEDWLRTDSGRAAVLLGTGVARVTVCRWGPVLVAEDLAASLGVTLGPAGGALLASVGIGGCWRDVEGAMGLERSKGILGFEDETDVSLEEEEREVCRFLILLVASCRAVKGGGVAWASKAGSEAKPVWARQQWRPRAATH